MSPVELANTRYGNSNASINSQRLFKICSCISSLCSGLQNTYCSTLLNWCTRTIPRVSRPAAPASLRKHGEYPAYLSGKSFSFNISSACKELIIISAVPAKHLSVSVNMNTSLFITDKSDPIKCPALNIVCGLVIDGHSIYLNPLEIKF